MAPRDISPSLTAGYALVSESLREIATVQDASLDEILHARRLVLRMLSDPMDRLEFLQALGVPYILCTCGASRPDESNPGTARVRALIEGWTVEMAEHDCDRGPRLALVARCPECTRARFHPEAAA